MSVQIDAPARKCNTCAWLVLADSGYSNYTVESTVAHCILNKHPDLPGETSYRFDEAFAFAQQCSTYMQGEPIELDVETEKAESYKQPMWEVITLYTNNLTVKAFLHVTQWSPSSAK